MSRATADHSLPLPPRKETSYTLGRHPRRPDHPALLNQDGTAAHTFHFEATRTEIAAILGARGLALHADGSVTQTAKTPSPTRRSVLAGLTGGALAGAFLAAPTAEAAVSGSWNGRDHYQTAMLLAFTKLSDEEQKGVMAFVREFGALAEQPIPAADHPDAELLAACEAFHEAFRIRAQTGLSDDEHDRRNAAWFAAMNGVIALPAVSQSGKLAKANVARVALMDMATVNAAGDWRDEVSPEQRLALDALADMIGGAA
jgi:hypothetical protein